MYHFFVEPGQVHDNYVEILGGDVNHMKNVLRMKPGEELQCIRIDRRFCSRGDFGTSGSVGGTAVQAGIVPVPPEGRQDGVDRPESGRTWSICGSSSCFQTLCGEAGCKEGG